MADAQVQPSSEAASPTAEATCDDCGISFDLHGLHETTALCVECFASYLDTLEVPFLEQYSRFGAKSRRTVAEALFRALVVADPDDRKVMGMRIVEEYLGAAGELMALYLALRNRGQSPVIRTFMDFELSESSVAVFRALTDGRSQDQLLRDLGFPTLTDLEAAKPEIRKRDFKQMRAAINAIPDGLERVGRLEARALLQLHDGLKKSGTLAQRVDWIPERGIQQHQVALLVLEHRQRVLVTHALSIEQPQLEVFVGAIDQITQAARDLIWLYLHTRDL